MDTLGNRRGERSRDQLPRVFIGGRPYKLIYEGKKAATVDEVKEVVLHRRSGAERLPDDSHCGCTAMIQTSCLEAFQYSGLFALFLAVRVTDVHARVR